MNKILTLPFILITLIASANNVQLTNISVTNNGTNTGKIIEFDLTWENSWRTASTGNWDGVWVFFKFKDNDGTWYPLHFTGTDIIMPAGAAYEMGNSGVVTGGGMFIYRAANGFGTAVATGIKAGIESFPGTFEIRGFALEMVFVPGGSFWLGDETSVNSYKEGSTANSPFQVTANGAGTNMGSSTGLLYDPQSAYSGNIPGFPTGYSGFWMMKYELSQGGYRDYFNTLTYTQQLNRLRDIFSNPASPTGTSINNSAACCRQYMEIAIPGNSTTNTPAVIGLDADGDNIFNEATDGEWITATYFTWPDVASYLDWAGLRPMTELEFEKACRGPLTPVAGEFAWGTNTIASYPYTIANAGTATENISNMSAILGNCNSGTSLVSLLRGGIFATGVSTRVSAGAGYYGTMELSGNISEIAITTGNEAGRSFNGKLGDGLLTTAGNANENNWPGVNGNTGTNVAPGNYDGGLGVRSDGGIRWRGGGFTQINNDSYKVSDRILFSGNGTDIFTNQTNKSFVGIRGVRDAN